MVTTNLPHLPFIWLLPYPKHTFTHTWQNTHFKYFKFSTHSPVSLHFSNWFPNWPLDSHTLLDHQVAVFAQLGTEYWQLPCTGAQAELRMWFQKIRSSNFLSPFTFLTPWLSVSFLPLIFPSTTWLTSFTHVIPSSNMHLADCVLPEMWLRLTRHPARC